MKRLTFLLIAVLFILTPVAAFAVDIYSVPQEVSVPKKAYGVWQCPQTETNSPLYQSANTTAARQRTIDKENSALIMPYGKGRAILDHQSSCVGKGLWEVNRMEVGGGAFLIREGKATLAYECTAILLCQRKKYNWQYNGTAIYPAKNDIVCISCADDSGKWVYLAYYKYLGKMP